MTKALLYPFAAGLSLLSACSDAPHTVTSDTSPAAEHKLIASATGSASTDPTNTGITGAHTQPNWVNNPVDYVNPLIGTEGVYNHRQGANVAVGAVLPFGMMNFGPEHAYTQDLLDESEGIKKRTLEEKVRIPVSPGGYNYSASRIKGFSFTRISGSGCLGASGDVPVLPFTAPITHSPDTDLLDAYYSAGFSHANETAKPGFYQVAMDNGVNVELSATRRSGIAQFTFDSAKDAKLLFRTAYGQLGSGDAFTQVDVAKGEISGYVTSGNFCGYLGEFNRRDYYTLHFVAKLDVPVSGSGTWVDDKVNQGATQAKGGMGYGSEGVPELGKGSGLWVDLALANTDTNQPLTPQTVTMRVGISYVSLENAKENLEQEQATQNFAQVKAQAKQVWDDALGKLKVSQAPTDKLTTFYTALYHAMHHPNTFSDVNGQYWGFDQKVHQITAKQHEQYANFSGWDVYRSQLQLVSLLEPKVASDIAQSLLNQANQYNGIWDRWTHNSGATGVMNGDPATIAIANFVAFGATDFNVNDAYQSLYRAATVPTALDLSDQGCPVFCRGQRPSLDQWLSINYISDKSNSWEGASETLEQVSADFALSQLASQLGDNSAAEMLLARSGYWQNLFNPKATATQGYLQGRNLDGSWKSEFAPNSEHLFVEGSPAQYLWMLPFDGQGLSQRLGGDAAMEARLDEHLHKADGSWVLFRDSAEFADVSNQPSITTPWMYLYTGAAYKTQETVRATLEQLWNTSTKGIPGQDDLGQMSSWYVFSALGIYPLYPGRADLVLTSPSFEAAQIGQLRINAQGALEDKPYIGALTVNGTPSTQSWLNNLYINTPTTLNFTLSATPNKGFGRALADRPVSYSVSTTVTSKADTPKP